MLNYRLLNTLLRSKPIDAFVIITSLLGIFALLDFFLLLQLARLIGPWLTLGALSFISALAFYLVHFTVYKRHAKVLESVRVGMFRDDLFPHYLCSLISAIFLVFPGIFNKIIGIFLLSRFASTRLGSSLTRLIGIKWEEAYEILKLNYFVLE